MVRSLEDRNRERTAFLLALYEIVDGEPSNTTSIDAVGELIDLEPALRRPTYQWLADRDLAKFVALGGATLTITARGVDKAEEILRDGYDLPASVLVLTDDEQRAVEAFLTAYRRAEENGEVPLQGDELLEADAEVRTIEAQLRSPRPKRRMVKGAIRNLRTLLQGATGSGIWAGVEQVLRAVL